MRLSIVICNYNYGRFLDDAIASAVTQTYENTEVIVIDDGSTDESADVIARWTGQITGIFQANGGQLSVYNRGFAEASGDVVVFLDSDDTLDPRAGEQIVAAFQDPSIAKVHFRLRLIDAAGTPLGVSIPRRLSDGDVSELLRRGMLYDSSPGSGNAYRRDVLARLMPLPVAAADLRAADFFTVHGAALLGEVRAIGPEPLAAYRVHADEAGQQLMFGNGRQGEVLVSRERYRRLRLWIVERLGPSYVIAHEFADFSIHKLLFADLVFQSEAYADGVRRGLEYFITELSRSIWQRSTPRVERVGLLAWAVAVIALPRDLGRPLARYVCNPASRGFMTYVRNLVA